VVVVGEGENGIKEGGSCSLHVHVHVHVVISGTCTSSSFHCWWVKDERGGLWGICRGEGAVCSHEEEEEEEEEEGREEEEQRTECTTRRRSIGGGQQVL